MKILIRENAAMLLVQNAYETRTNKSAPPVHNIRREALIQTLQGQWLDVETEYADHYITECEAVIFKFLVEKVKA